LGFGEAFCGSRRGLLQVPPSLSSFGVPAVVGGVVAVELEPSLSGNAPKNPDVYVGHDPPELPAVCFLAAPAMADAFLLFWLKTPPRKREELGSLSAPKTLS
jgi:hypothetical protein